MSLSSQIKIASHFIQHGNSGLDINMNQLKSSPPLCFFIPSTHNEFTVIRTVCRSLLFLCQRAFTQQRRSELSDCLCLKTQWTIQVGSPSAHTPANTLHCCHRTRLKFYTNPVVMGSPEGKMKGDGHREKTRDEDSCEWMQRGRKKRFS